MEGDIEEDGLSEGELLGETEGDTEADETITSSSKIAEPSS